MKHEKIGVRAGDTDAGSLLAGGEHHIAQGVENLNLKAALSAARGSGIRAFKSQYSYLFGGARVCIGRRNGMPYVFVSPQPWGGWQNTAKECLTEAGAERYARKLLERLDREGLAEFERRERLLQARLAERVAR